MDPTLAEGLRRYLDEQLAGLSREFAQREQRYLAQIASQAATIDRLQSADRASPSSSGAGPTGNSASLPPAVPPPVLRSAPAAVQGAVPPTVPPAVPPVSAPRVAPPVPPAFVPPIPPAFVPPVPPRAPPTVPPATSRSTQSQQVVRASGPSAAPPQHAPPTAGSASPLPSAGASKRSVPRQGNQGSSAKRSPSHKERQKKKKKAGTDLHRLLKTELPEDIGGTQKAMNTHIRILSNSLESYSLLGDASPEVLAKFKSTFTTENDIRAASKGPPLIPPDRVAIAQRSRMTAAHGTHAASAAMVDDLVLEMMQARCAQYGLEQWCPDHSQAPYSLYNSLCRTIAIDTFRQALVSHAYDFFEPNLAYASQTLTLVKLYDHYVCFKQARRSQHDARHPGKLIAREKRAALYAARRRLRNLRKKTAKEERLPERVVDLVEDLKAHSDAEWNSTTNQYEVSEQVGRAEAVTQLFMWLDERHELRVSSIGGGSSGRKRVRVKDPKQSQLKQLPKTAPIDYFDVDFYNCLPFGVRSKITTYQVALPKDIIKTNADGSSSFNRDHAALKLTNERFMKRYGLDILASYHTEADDADDEDDGEWLSGDEDVEMEDEEEQLDEQEQRQFALQMDVDD